MDGGLKVLLVEQEVAGDIRPSEGKPDLGSDQCKDNDLREPKGARGARAQSAPCDNPVGHPIGFKDGDNCELDGPAHGSKDIIRDWASCERL
jgi:hypothetical protein